MKAEEYYKKLGKVIISASQIERKVKEMAKQISKDYDKNFPVLISNLKGSFRFLADIVKYVKIPVMIDFIAFQSYEGHKSIGNVRVIKDLKIDVSNKNILLVEDIVDTGITLDYIIKYLEEFKKPIDIRVCTLLDKPSKRKVYVPIHYKGFDIPDVFVVGYGLDYKEFFRELNDIYELKID